MAEAGRFNVDFAELCERVVGGLVTCTTGNVCNDVMQAVHDTQARHK